jgi:Na+(H+)/acetate symporter ActP
VHRRINPALLASLACGVGLPAAALAAQAAVATTALEGPTSSMAVTTGWPVLCFLLVARLKWHLRVPVDQMGTC